MAATETAFLTMVLTLGGAAAMGFVLYKLISKSGETENATDHERNWLAWVVFLPALLFYLLLLEIQIQIRLLNGFLRLSFLTSSRL